VLLLSCSTCSAHYFSAASTGTCPDCGAELAAGSPARSPVMDLDGNGHGSNGDRARESEFGRLWQLLLDQGPLRTDKV